MTILEKELIYDERLLRSGKRHDLLLWALVGVASVLSIGAFAYFSHKGVIFGHRDSISHLVIARRVLAGSEPHLLLLGSVWLPLLHAFMVPFVWITPLYESGLAGGIVSMTAYVVTASFVYKIVRGLTDNRIAALSGALVFVLNPNMLYLQTTAMMEPLFFATIASTVYYLQQWIQGKGRIYVVMAGITTTLSCLTRYEAWIMTFVFIGIVLYICLLRDPRKEREGDLFAYMSISSIGILGWFLWNWNFFGSPLYFRTSEYGDPALWQNLDDPSVGHWSVALKTYWYAVRDDINLAVIGIAVIGFAVLALRRKRDALPILSTALLFPFFVWSVQDAQSPLRVLQTSNSMFNLRYGLVMLLPAAVAVGYLAGWVIRMLPIAKWGTTVAVVVAAVTPFALGGLDGLVTYKEAVYGMQASRASDQYATSQFLLRQYDGGKILAESSNNETVIFDSHIPLGENIYEGSYKKWEPALEHPAQHDIRWIIMRRSLDSSVKRTAADKVYAALYDSPELNAYTTVYTNESYIVLKRK